MTYRWLMFDADGTLFDYDAAEGKALRRTLAIFGLPYNGQVLDIYRRINGQLWLDLEQGLTTRDELRLTRFSHLFAAIAGDHPAPAAGEFSRAYLETLGNCADLMPGAATLLGALHGSYNLALITNGFANVQRSRLSRSGLAHYFDPVVISDEVGVAKPDPRIFDLALERMRCPARSEVLMIGDSLSSDIAGAVSYGIDACWYNPEERAADADLAARYEIRALGELLDILA
jgi:YjjG family noncanonical pyrimidine nucleotidase